MEDNQTEEVFVERRQDVIELERRIGHLEREMAGYSAVLARNTEILDEIRTYVNRETNWPEWITAIMGIGGTLGVILWAVFVQPVEIKVNAQAAKVEQIEHTLERNKDLFHNVIDGINDHIMQHDGEPASK